MQVYPISLSIKALIGANAGSRRDRFLVTSPVRVLPRRTTRRLCKTCWLHVVAQHGIPSFFVGLTGQRLRDHNALGNH